MRDRLLQTLQTFCCLFAFYSSVFPAPAPRPMIPSDIDTLRRSIAVLRESVGNSISDAQLHISSSQSKTNLAKLYGKLPSDTVDTGIINVKADLRAMNEADSIQMDGNIENEQWVMQADRAHQRMRLHHHRHHHHRKRRKGCGSSRHGHRQMLCPSRSSHQYDVCITAEQLCDDIPDCPGGEDENPTNCLFYTTTKEQLKHIYNTVLLLANHATGHHEL